jgi:hypothetical protein
LPVRDNQSTLLKRLLVLATVIAVIAGIVWGIAYLEAMRIDSAKARRAEQEQALEAGKRLQEGGG